MTVVLAVIVTASCAEPGSQPADRKTATASAPVVVSPEAAVKRLLLGSGEMCQDDRGCGESPFNGVCMMGTCFGLLTTDSAPARSVLCSRLAGATVELRKRAEAVLLKALVSTTSTRARVATLEGLGALLSAAPTKPCAEVCTALRKESQSSDPQLASTARRALASRGDETVLDALLMDLQEGAPHLSCATARALRGYRRGPVAVKARDALSKAAQGGNRAVARVARRALMDWGDGR